MSSLNKVMLIGNITRDPEIKYTPKGTAVAELSLAVNRKYTAENGEKREDVTFVDVTLWGRVAEIADEYLKKGAPVFIEGRLQLDTWEDKQTGQKRSKMRVVGESLQLLGSKSDGDRRESRSHDEPTRREQPRQERSRPTPPAKPPHDPDLDVSDADLPF